LGVYRRMLDFLRVNYDGQKEFEVRYASQMYRFRWLQRLLFVPIARNSKTVDTLQRRARKYNADGSKRPSLVKRVTNLNKRPRSPAPLTRQMADTIRNALQQDVERLSGLLNRNLEFWFEES